MWQSGDKAMVLCFVEFTDTRCALAAVEALQGLVLLLNLLKPFTQHNMEMIVLFAETFTNCRHLNCH